MLLNYCLPPLIDPKLIDTQPTPPKKLIHPAFGGLEIRSSGMSQCKLNDIPFRWIFTAFLIITGNETI